MIFFFLVVPYSAILLSLSVLRYRASIWAFLYLRESAKKRERSSLLKTLADQKHWLRTLFNGGYRYFAVSGKIYGRT